MPDSRSDIACGLLLPLRPSDYVINIVVVGLNASCHGYDVISFSSMIGQAPCELTQAHGPVSSSLSPAALVQVSRAAPQGVFHNFIKKC